MLSSSKAYIPMLDAGGVKVNPCFLCMHVSMIVDSHDSAVIIGSVLLCERSTHCVDCAKAAHLVLD